MFTGKFDYETDKVPTFAQYCKAHGEKARNHTSVVTLIWKPNAYPNYTFQTEKFKLRIRVTEDNREQLADLLQTTIEEGICLAVTILDPKNYTFTIDSHESETVAWTQLGDSGYRAEIQEKSSKGKSKKRVPSTDA